MKAFTLRTNFESTFPKEEVSTHGTDGHSTLWPTICIIFCRKMHHCLPYISHTQYKLPGCSFVPVADEKAPRVQAAEGDTTTCGNGLYAQWLDEKAPRRQAIAYFLTQYYTNGRSDGGVAICAMCRSLLLRESRLKCCPQCQCLHLQCLINTRQL